MFHRCILTLFEVRLKCTFLIQNPAYKFIWNKKYFDHVRRMSENGGGRSRWILLVEAIHPLQCSQFRTTGQNERCEAILNYVLGGALRISEEWCALDNLYSSSRWSCYKRKGRSKHYLQCWPYAFRNFDFSWVKLTFVEAVLSSPIFLFKANATTDQDVHSSFTPRCSFMFTDQIL